jgi:cbb3-type cytochrome oxidase subunit 3
MYNSWRLITFFICLISLLFIAYAPGLYGDFEFDDQANLLQNTDIQIEELSRHGLTLAALSGEAGPLGRPVSMVTFAINHAITGFDPFYLKLTNLTIHALSGVTLFLLLAQLLPAYRRTYSIATTDQTLDWIALLITAAWTLHPLNITSVLYIVQRMTSLSGLFSLLALYFYALGRNKTQEGSKYGWWNIFVCSPLAGTIALFCKENAAVLPLLIFLIEYFFFRFSTSTKRESRTLHVIFALTLWAPLIAFTWFIFFNPEWLSNGFSARGFTLSERLMTESRVLWLYLRIIIAPDMSLMGIYHDDISISTGWFSPASTLIATLGLIVLFFSAILARHRAPMLAFGILWFFAGHIIESSFLPLEIAHEHRNYLPLIGPLVTGIYYLVNSPVTAKIGRTPHLLAVLLISILAFSTHVRASQWGDLLEHAMVEAENHPESPRAQQQLGRMYYKLYKADAREEFYEKARKAFEASSSLDPNFKGGLYARIILDYNAGKIPPSSVLMEFRDRLLHSKPEAGDVEMFNSLLKCQLSGDCKLPDQAFIDLFEIEVHRYKGDPKRQASFLSFLGSYAAQKMDDESLAGKYLKRAVDVYPHDVQGRLNYAWYLEVIGQYSAAELQLAAAARVDSMNKYEQRILAAQKSIQARKDKAQGIVK